MILSYVCYLSYTLLFAGECLVGAIRSSIGIFGCVVIFAYASMAASEDLSSRSVKDTAGVIVAKQGIAVVTLADIDAFADTIPENRRAGFFNSPERIQTAIQNLLLDKQLAAEATQSGLDKQPLVKVQLQLAVDSALAKIRMQQFTKDIKQPDFDALAHERYISEKEKYVIPGRIDVQQILFSTNSQSEEEAKTKAEAALKEAKAHPEQFSELIEKYSDDPAKDSKHGLATDAESKEYPAEFSQAAKSLKQIGSISPVVNTQRGYYILKLNKRIPEQQQSFADVREKILAELSAQYISKQTGGHTDELRNLPIDANADVVGSLRTRYHEGEVPQVPKQNGG